MLILLSACATAPSPAPKEAGSATPATPSAIPVLPNAKAAEQWKQRAQKAYEAGDLRLAADCWHVVALLVPEDSQARRVWTALRQDLADRAGEAFAAGSASMRKGDNDAAVRSFLKAMMYDPAHQGAAQALRSVERSRIERTQGERAGAVQEANGAERKSRSGGRSKEVASNDELDQRLELFEAGDIGIGLTELQRFVDTKPKDQETRQKVSGAVYQKARKLDGDGDGEAAVPLYERTATMGGPFAPDAAARAQALRRQLSKKYFLEGQRVYRNDLAGAILNWENAVRLDPTNDAARSRLNEGLKMQETLKQIDRAKKTP